MNPLKEIQGNTNKLETHIMETQKSLKEIQKNKAQEIIRWQKANVGTLQTKIKAIWHHLNLIHQPQQVLDTPAHQKNKS